MKPNIYDIISMAAAGKISLSDKNDPECLYDFIQGCLVFKNNPGFEESPPFKILVNMKIVAMLNKEPQITVVDFLQIIDKFQKFKISKSIEFKKSGGQINCMEQWTAELKSFFSIKVNLNNSWFYEPEVYLNEAKCLEHVVAISKDDFDEQFDFLTQLERNASDFCDGNVFANFILNKSRK